eukprot:2394094-Pleurochrysis_carterae.AAC.9
MSVWHACGRAATVSMHVAVRVPPSNVRASTVSYMRFTAHSVMMVHARKQVRLAQVRHRARGLIHAC